MPTLAELKVRAKRYGLSGYSRLRKLELTEKIIQARYAEQRIRLQRAQPTGRFQALREDINNPHKQGRVRRELRQLDAEVIAALHTKGVEKKKLRPKEPLERLAAKRNRRLRLVGDILREGRQLRAEFLGEDGLLPTEDVGRRTIIWTLKSRLNQSTVEKFMEKIATLET